MTTAANVGLDLQQHVVSQFCQSLFSNNRHAQFNACLDGWICNLERYPDEVCSSSKTVSTTVGPQTRRPGTTGKFFATTNQLYMMFSDSESTVVLMVYAIIGSVGSCILIHEGHGVQLDLCTAPRKLRDVSGDALKLCVARRDAFISIGVH